MFNSLNVSVAYAITARKGVATLFLLLFSAVSAFAQTTFTSAQSGNWNSASTWDQNAIPTAADNVIIEGGHSINVNISNAACASLDIGRQTKATATLNFNANSGLTVTGAITFGGNGNSLRTGAIDMTYGGLLTCGSISVVNFSSWTPGAGTVEFTGTFTLPSEFTTFNNLKITSGTVTLASDVFLTDTLFLESGTFATANNFTIGTGGVITRGTGTMTGRVQGTNAYNLYYTGTSKTTGLERTGTGLQHLYVNLNSVQTLTLDTIFSIADLSISSGTVTNNGNILNISGNLTLNGTLSGSGIIRMTGSNKQISGTGTINITDTLSFLSGNKTIASGANITVSGPINIIGGITLTNNGTLTSTSTTGITGSVVGSTFSNGPSATLNISGSLLNTGTLSATGTGNTINYLNTSTGQTVKDGIYHHLNINKSGQTATLGGNITVNGNQTITAGTLDVSSNNYTITVKGNIINNGTFTYRNGSVAFNGTSSQSITGSSTTQFYNLSLSNSSGLSLSSDLTVNGTLTFNSGLISTGSYKVIIPASASVSSASSSSYVNGNLQKNFATGSNVNRTFEVGTSNKYLPVTLNFSTVSTAGNIILKATNGEHPQISSACISNSGNVNAYWSITNGTVAPSSYTATFNYNASDFDNGANYQYFLLGRYSSGWTEVTPTSVTSTGLSEDGISGFGDFVIGETNPKIYTHPANSTACTGDNKTFTIAATGSAVNYQWQENQGSGWSNITDGGIYSGATTTTLTLTGVSNTMDGYQYRCYAVTSSGCVNSDTSTAAALSFSTSFTIDTQPANASVCSGGNTAFTTAASGAVSGYQWQVNTGSSWANVSDNSTYSGATTTTLSITKVQVSMSGYLYRCIVQSNCVNDDTTTSASLTTLTPPSLNSHPSNVSTCELQSPVFSVSASGSNLTYQWQVSTNSGSSWSDITDGSVYTNSTTASLTLTSVPLSMNGYQFRCVVSGSCVPPVTSNAGSLTLSARPSVTLNPSDVTIYYNTNRNASYSVSASGAGTLSYQWQQNTGSGWANVSDTGVYSGSATITLNITNAHLSMDQIAYRCLVSGTCSPPDTSATAYLYVSFHFTITSNSNWSALSPTPTSSSTMEVKGGATITVDVTNAVIGTIQLGRKTNPSAGNGTLAFNSGSYLQVLGPGSNIVLGEHNKSGSISMTNGGHLSCKGFIINSFGAFAPGSGTMEITGTYTLPANFTTFNNLIASGPLVTLGAGTTVNGYLKVDTSSTLATVGNSLSIAGNLEVNGTLSGTGAITLSGNGTKIRGIGSITNTGTLTLSANKTIDTSASLTVAGTVAIGSAVTVTNYGTFTSSSTSGITGAASTSTWINEVNSTLSSSGPILATGTLTVTATDNTIKYEGISANVTVKPTTYYNLTIFKATKTATLSSAATVSNRLYLENGVFATSTNLTMGNLSTIQVAAGTMTGTLQGSNSYDISYINNSKSTSSEFTGAGLRDVNVSLETGQTVTLASGFTTGRALNITSGTIDVSSNNYNIVLKGNFSNTGGTFVPRAGTVTMSGTSAQTISGTSNTDFYNLTINNSSGVTLSTAANLSGTMSLTGGVFATGTNLTTLTDATIEIGEGSMTGTIQGNNPYNITYIGLSKSTGAELSGSNVRDITVNVNSGETVTMSSAMTVNRNLTVNSNTTLDVSAGNYALNLKGNFTNNGTFYARNGKFSFVGTSVQVISGSSSNTFHKMALSNASGLTLSSALQVNDSLQLISGTLTASTNLTMGTGATIARSGGSFSGTLQGTNAYDVFYSGNSKTTGSIVTNTGLRDVKIGLTGGQTLTLNSNLSLSRNLLISTGTLDVSTSNYSITVKGNFTNNSTFNARSGKVTFDGTGAQSISGSASITFNKLTVNKSADSLKLGRNITIGDSLTLTAGNLAVQTYTLTLNGAISATSGSLSSSSTGTVSYNQSTAGQSVLAANYGNLTFSNYDKTLASGGTIGIAGTFTTGSATGHTITGSTIDFNGATQNIPTFTFNNLTISGGGVKTLTGGNTTVNGVLSLSNGKVSTGSNVLIIESGGSITGASSSNYVSGNLRKHIGTGSNVGRTFEIGNSSSYLPVALTFATVSASGYVTASNTDGDHPQISSSCINPDTSVNRYWQLSSTGGLTFDNYSATATFVNTDEDAGADYNNYRIAVYTSSWANPTVGNTTSTSTTATGITSLGDIQIGEANPTAVTANPADSTICNGSNTHFAITAIGTELSYQWQEFNGSAWSDLTDNSTYSGSTTDTLDITAAGSAMNGHKYRCLVSAPCTPNDTSAEATLTINEAPEITTEPLDTTVSISGTTSFWLGANNATGYQWQVYDGNSWTNVSNSGIYTGATTDSLVLTSVPFSEDGNKYRCLVSGNCEPEDTAYAALLTVNDQVNTAIDIKAFLEGAYNGSSMTTLLNSGGYIPLNQPYNTSPWDYQGNESVASIPNSNVVDWVLVELREASLPALANSTTITQRKAGFILADGTIVGLDGVNPLEFDLNILDTYFIVVYHRSHLPVMSANGINYFSNLLTIDLTAAASAAYSNTALIDLGGAYGLPTGSIELNTPFEIDNNDTSAAWDSRNQSGYLKADCNLDGLIDATDRSIILNNKNKQAIMP